MKSEYVGRTNADKDVLAKIECTLVNNGNCRLAIGARDKETLTMCISGIIFKLLEDKKEDIIIEACEIARGMLNDR